MNMKFGLLTTALLALATLAGCRGGGSGGGVYCQGDWVTQCRPLPPYGGVICERRWDPCARVVRDRDHARGPIVRVPGHPGRGPGHVPGRGPGRHYTAAFELTPAQELASRFSIPQAAADKIVVAYADAITGDTKSALDLGLTNSDLLRMDAFGSISDDAASRVASNLGLETAKVKEIATTLTKEFEQMFTDPKSPHWQKCFNAGSWKTPENRWCEKEFWQGCSPATGASRCEIEE